MIPRLCVLPLALLVTLSGCTRLTVEEAALAEDLPDFNRLVLEVCSEYPRDGTIDYWWPKSEDEDYVRYDGCSRDMTFMGEQVMSGEAEGRTYCCGYTLEIFLEAYSRWLSEHGEEAAQIAPDDWRQFQRLWFVTDLNGPGPSQALEAFDLGSTFAKDDWDDVLPGDFCQIWRTEQRDGKISGHSVIFLNWLRDTHGEIAGMRYFSSQPSTDGVGHRNEWFGAAGGVSRHFTHIGRAEPERGLAPR